MLIFLELLDEVARVLKGNSVVFGSVHMIFVGDFGQLAPVADLIRRDNGDNIKLLKEQVKYASNPLFTLFGRRQTYSYSV